MGQLHQLSQFLRRITADVNLRTCHISLYTVLCQVWLENGCKSPFNISRRKIMSLSRINSLATYHQVIRDLIIHRYIHYNPSYHPVKGSEVSLIDPTL